MKTSLMQFVYPTMLDPLWYGTFETLMGQLDVSILAALENPSLVLTGGGTISLDGDILTWTDDLVVLALQTGGKVTVPAGSLSGFSAGSIAYVEVSRPVAGSTIGSIAKAYSLSGAIYANYVPLIVRVDDALVMRNQVTSTSGLAATSDFRGDRKITTPSIGASDTYDGSFSIGISTGIMNRIQFTRTAATSFDVSFYSDSDRTDLLFNLTVDLSVSPSAIHRTPVSIDDLTDGVLYYSVLNDGLDASVLSMEPVFIGVGA